MLRARIEEGLAREEALQVRCYQRNGTVRHGSEGGI